MKKNLGMTLIELMLVIIILGTMSYLVRLSYVTIVEKTQMATSKSNLAILQKQIWLYYNQNEGKYPPNLDTLVEDGYLTRVPEVNIKYHIRTRGVIVSSQPYTPDRDEGKWYYNYITGEINIACTHTDLEGVEIYRW